MKRPVLMFTFLATLSACKSGVNNDQAQDESGVLASRRGGDRADDEGGLSSILGSLKANGEVTPPSDQVSLNDLNKVIAGLDQIKLMNTLGKNVNFDPKNATYSTFGEEYLGSKLQCVALKPDLQDAKCEVVGYSKRVLKDMVHANIGNYYFPAGSLRALCEVTPGDWKEGGPGKPDYVKPKVKGLPWNCSKARDWQPF